jgi:hypothetical protein
MDNLTEKAKGVVLALALFLLLAWPFLALVLTMSASQ